MGENGNNWEKGEKRKRNGERNGKTEETGRNKKKWKTHENRKKLEEMR